MKNVLAIDISGKMVLEAKKKISNQNINNVTFEVMDIFDARLSDKVFDVIMGINVLHLCENVDQVLGRIKELLQPFGVLLTATVCLGERPTFLMRMFSVLSKMGIIPSMRKFTLPELEGLIRKNGFEILEIKRLDHKYPNYFIAAKKV